MRKGMIFTFSLFKGCCVCWLRCKNDIYNVLTWHIWDNIVKEGVILWQRLIPNEETKEAIEEVRQMKQNPSMGMGCLFFF